MSSHDDTWQQLTVAEAAVILGVSTATVRRMVRAGKLGGEAILRPQGKVYVVRLPRHVAGTEHVPPDMPRDSAQGPKTGDTAARVSPAEQMMAAWSASVLTPILAPIVAELTASRQQLIAQAETIGTLRATVTALEAQNAALLAPPATQAPEPSRGGGHSRCLTLVTRRWRMRRGGDAWCWRCTDDDRRGALDHARQRAGRDDSHPDDDHGAGRLSRGGGSRCVRC